MNLEVVISTTSKIEFHRTKDILAKLSQTTDLRRIPKITFNDSFYRKTTNLVAMNSKQMFQLVECRTVSECVTNTYMYMDNPSNKIVLDFSPKTDPTYQNILCRICSLWYSCILHLHFCDIMLSKYVVTWYKNTYIIWKIRVCSGL